MNTIRINSGATIRREAITENHDCLIVDDFLEDPHELVGFAARHASEFEKAKSAYPGLLFRVDGDAMTAVYRFIRSKMTKHFPFLRGDMILWTYLSIATLRPEELSFLQRLCHTDPNTRPGRANYAAIIYLFENERLGGTSFYRWRRPDLMTKVVNVERETPGQGLTLLQNIFPAYRNSASYMTDSNEVAELLYAIPARYNRMIFSSGEVPHSAAIAAPELLSRDMREGRLTLNVFASVWPKSAESLPAAW